MYFLGDERGSCLCMTGFKWSFEGGKECDVFVSFLLFVIEDIAIIEWRS